MKTNSFPLKFILSLSLLLGFVWPDPDPLQDYCVANTKTPQTSIWNGPTCINPEMTSSSHFTTSALSKPSKSRDTDFNLTLASVVNLPGLNTLGLTMARIDIAPDGLVPPHIHPRASEVIILLRGSIQVGFVDTSNHIYTQKLSPGESFVFPKAMVHYLYNIGPVRAMVVSGFSSQNPGTQMTPIVTLASKSIFPDKIRMRASQINGQDVTFIQQNLGG